MGQLVDCILYLDLHMLTACRLSESLASEPTYKYVNERRVMFDSVEELLPHATVPSFKEWRAARLVELIRSIPAFTFDDAEPLLALIPVMAPEIYFEV